MSTHHTSPPIEEQHRFARTQTPESPRPVHVPEPAKIPVLLNQMDPSSNDLKTYGVPLDSNFDQYGDSLENPAHKSSHQEDAQSMQAFLDNAASVIATDPNSNASASDIPKTNVNVNANASMQYTNHPGSALSSSLLASNPHFSAAVLQQPSISNGAQNGTAVESTGLSESQKESETDDYEPTVDQEQKNSEEGAQTAPDSSTVNTGDTVDISSDVKSVLSSGMGVDYQSLLDTITQSASTAPAAENIAAPTTDATMSDSHPSSLPVFPGLPPKPPPLETQTATSASAAADHVHAQQQSRQNAVQALLPQQSTANGYSYQTNPQGDNTMTQPLPVNPFEGSLTNEQAISMHMQQNQQNPQGPPATPPDRAETEPADRPWSPKTQAIYDGFLEDERRYVTEGIWDRFPIGSRLFVGNLPSEKVTKRDLFHRFHQHGKLAQISIKQAYGFIQFHDAQSCKAALDAEQGVELRGRKVHLEISKPQKGSKSAAQQSSQNTKNQPRRRSRSPVRRPYTDFRDEPSRRREEYRRRSPSPRGYRRDDRGAGRDDRRSPVYSSSYGTPQPAYDDEASLPYPRRDPRYVPDVQVIVLEAGVDQAFLNWVEDGLKRKGLSAASTWLNQRTPLQAVVKRQIMEGVQAVVKIGAANQMRSKVPLQVFDRSAGTSNITFNEYVDLDVPIAADIVLQARQRERSAMQPPRPSFTAPFVPPNPYQQQSPNSPWTPQASGMPQYPPHPLPPPQHYQYAPQPAQPMPQQYRPQQSYSAPNSASSQPPNLHELLANLKGGPGAPPTPQSAHSAGQPYTPYGQPPPPPQQYYGQPAYPQAGPPLPPQQNGAGQQNVQNIMDQLARFQQR